MKQGYAAALMFVFAAGLPAGGQAAPLGPNSAGQLAGDVRTEVALGCGPGHTRGHFGACVRLHHRHHRMHGGHSGHDYDIHDRRHYHAEPHLYHGPRHHRRGAHRH